MFHYYFALIGYVRMLVMDNGSVYGNLMCLNNLKRPQAQEDFVQFSPSENPEHTYMCAKIRNLPL
jgi:hypothetical protein